MATEVTTTPKRKPMVREPMVMVKELCIECAVCREVCPYTAVFFVPTKWKIALQVDQVRCTGCGGPEHAPCVQFCPSPGALVPASALLTQPALA
jgi:NAD-dependent dihydropyrimidine dehydrogenase PreA subunit